MGITKQLQRISTLEQIKNDTRYQYRQQVSLWIEGYSAG